MTYENEEDWREAYVKQAESLRKFSFRRIWRKDRVVAQLYILAEIVKRHPNYPQQADHRERAGSTGRSISIPAFLQLLDNCKDITPFLVAHYETLEESASQLDKEKFLDRLFKIGGGGGILYGLWKVLCRLFIEPVLGIPCDFGDGGSLISSLTPLVWIFGGIGLIFLHKALSSSMRKNQVIFRH